MYTFVSMTLFLSYKIYSVVRDYDDSRTNFYLIGGKNTQMYILCKKFRILRKSTHVIKIKWLFLAFP